MARGVSKNSIKVAADVSKSKNRAKRIGPHRLYSGDCVAVIQRLRARSVDVVVTSPPYNIDLQYHAYQDNRAEEDYLAWIKQVAMSLKRVMKDDGSFFLNVSGSNRKPWLPFMIVGQLREVFELQNHFVWVKSIAVERRTRGHFKPIAGSRFTHHNHEHVFHFSKSGNVALDRLAIGVPFSDKSNIQRFGHRKDLRCRGNTWFIPYQTVNTREKKFNHPGTFPVELPLWCMYLHGKREGIVLDPFVGSGTTIVAAECAGYHGIGIELDEIYLKAARERIDLCREATLHLTLNDREQAELLKQESLGLCDMGFESFIITLQERSNKTSQHLALFSHDIKHITYFSSQSKIPEHRSRLRRIFARHLKGIWT